MNPIRILKNRWYKYRFTRTHRLTQHWFLNDYFDEQQKIEVKKTHDPVRYGTILLAKEQMDTEKIEGDIINPDTKEIIYEGEWGNNKFHG